MIKIFEIAAEWNVGKTKKAYYGFGMKANKNMSLMEPNFAHGGGQYAKVKLEEKGSRTRKSISKVNQLIEQVEEHNRS